jgi:hypothetical protein
VSIWQELSPLLNQLFLSCFFCMPCVSFYYKTCFVWLIALHYLFIVLGGRSWMVKLQWLFRCDFAERADVRLIITVFWVEVKTWTRYVRKLFLLCRVIGWHMLEIIKESIILVLFFLYALCFILL